MATFRVEKNKNFTAMSNVHLRDKNLSAKAKGLLSLMLSMPEDWNFTLAGLKRYCKDGIESLSAAIKELEEAGYVTREWVRGEKNRIDDLVYTIFEIPRQDFIREYDLPLEAESEEPENGSASGFAPTAKSPSQEKPKSEKPTQVKPTLVTPSQEKPGAEKPTQVKPASESPSWDFPYTGFPYTENPVLLNTNILNTKIQNTINPSINQREKIDRIDRIKNLETRIKENIDYPGVVSRFGTARAEEVVGLMLEPFISRKATFRIAGGDYPIELVRDRMLSLGFDHVEYVFECLDQISGEIANIKAYMQTALYNAPLTIHSYYAAQVRHDSCGA